MLLKLERRAVMIYMLQVYLLVAVPVFALAGVLTLALVVGTKIQDYVRARRAMRQIVLTTSGRLRGLSTIDRLERSHTFRAA
jgi:hypothetical protein